MTIIDRRSSDAITINIRTTTPQVTSKRQRSCLVMFLKSNMGWILCSGTLLDTKKRIKKKSEEKIQMPDQEDMDPREGKLKRGSSNGNTHITALTFTYHELATATKNFSAECLLGEGGFGRVYKGHLQNIHRGVAIKQLNPEGLQGTREFLVEVLMLSICQHPHLVKLIGYCYEGDQRLLVYEYMSLGCLEDHLHDITPDKKPLDWNTRMKIAAGAAKGLEYLHCKADPPVIYRDLKCSNILLGEGYHPKLSDFGLAKIGPMGQHTHVSTRVMGTHGYCAPEYAVTGKLTMKSDIFSFGVVLLEIITGRKAIDESKSAEEQNLVTWARPLFRNTKTFIQMADPMLQGQYPLRGLYQAIAIAAMCLDEKANMRPPIHDIVTALSYLAEQRYDPNAPKKQSSNFSPGTQN